MDVSPLLKYFNAQWRLAADARSASKQRVYLINLVCSMFNECSFKAKIRVFAFDYINMNVFKFLKV